MGRRTEQRVIRRVDARSGEQRQVADHLVAEEPLEIRVRGRSLVVTMRTPGDDHDLVLGFLLSEGIVTRCEEVRTLRYCAGKDATGTQTYNVLDAALAPHVPDPGRGSERASVMSAACGVCGKQRIEDVRTASVYPPNDDPTIFDPAWLASLPERLREGQATFERTGALHGAALARPGAALLVREDVGRHNAVDKVLGTALRSGGVPARGAALVVSGRAGFELVQKAQMAGVPAMVAVSAPSALAVDLAEESGMLLAGFARDGAFNLYAGGHRLAR